MQVKKIKFKNGSWVVVFIAQNGMIYEVHSNGLVYPHKTFVVLEELCAELISSLSPARGEATVDEVHK